MSMYNVSECVSRAKIREFVGKRTYRLADTKHEYSLYMEDIY